MARAVVLVVLALVAVGCTGSPAQETELSEPDVMELEDWSTLGPRERLLQLRRALHALSQGTLDPAEIGAVEVVDPDSGQRSFHVDYFDHDTMMVLSVREGEPPTWDVEDFLATQQ